MNRAATIPRWCPPAHHASDVTLLTVNVLQATRRGTRRPAQRDPRHPGRVRRDRDARRPAGMTATRASASAGAWTGGRGGALLPRAGRHLELTTAGVRGPVQRATTRTVLSSASAASG